jgi:hypothetical protein
MTWRSMALYLARWRIARGPTVGRGSTAPNNPLNARQLKVRNLSLRNSPVFFVAGDVLGLGSKPAQQWQASRQHISEAVHQLIDRILTARHALSEHGNKSRTIR